MTLIPLKLAEIKWTDEGYPINLKSQDKYFTKDGLGESDYVFLEGCHLKQRWLDWNKSNYTILETGFGTGLNFLLVFQLWKQQANRGSISFNKLCFLSIENSPIPINLFKRIHKLWPELKIYSDELIEKLPEPIPGRHLIKFECNNYVFELILFYEDVDTVLPQISEENSSSIDSFFLDGFSPQKNEDMWQEKVFVNLAKLAHYKATLSTYTAASFVRKHLEKHGFKVIKCKGFGSKREMLTANFSLLKNKTVNLKPRTDLNILVIGAGLAGAITAAKLADRGYSVDIAESGDEFCTGASGNAAGIAYPKLGNTYSESCQLHICGDNFLHAELQNLHNVNANFSGMEFIYGKQNANSRITSKTLERLNIQNSYIRNISPDKDNQSSDRLEYIKAGWIEPASLAKSYICQHIKQQKIRPLFNCKVTSLEQFNNKWIAKGDSRISCLNYAMVFMCNGSEISELLPEYEEFTVPVKGQIDCFKVTQKHKNIDRPICSNGYIIPYKKDSSNTSVYWVGASYQPNSKENLINNNETLIHQTKLAYHLELTPSEIQHIDSRVSNRLASNDRMPLVGEVVNKVIYCDWYKKILKSSRFKELNPVSNGLYINVGHGSHGLVTIPIMSEYLVRKALGELLTISPTIANAVDPQRFSRRKIKKSGDG